MVAQARAADAEDAPARAGSRLTRLGAAVLGAIARAREALLHARQHAAPDGTLARPCERAPAGMSCVPGGYFVRGLDADPHTSCSQRFGSHRRVPNAQPSARVWQETVYMDVHEVTYAEYKACRRAGACKGGGPAYRDFDDPRQPITGVSWHNAVEFCTWKGKHLPTEAEWEKAARGSEGELYPWGDEPASCERAVIYDRKRGRACGVKKRTPDPEGKSKVVEVGSRPAGRYGLYDMVGNVEEWVADWYTNSWAECGQSCEGVSPRGPCDGAAVCPGHRFKVVRGGSWYWEAEHGTGYHRRPHVPANQPTFHHFGFRCAASPEEVRALAAE